MAELNPHAMFNDTNTQTSFDKAPTVYAELERSVQRQAEMPYPLYVIVHSTCDHGIKPEFNIISVLARGFHGPNPRMINNRFGMIYTQSIVELQTPNVAEDMEIVIEAPAHMPNVTAVGCSRDKGEASSILNDEVQKCAEKRKLELKERRNAEVEERGMSKVEKEAYVEACVKPDASWHYDKENRLHDVRFKYSGGIEVREEETHWWEVVYVDMAQYTYNYSKDVAPTEEAGDDVV